MGDACTRTTEVDQGARSRNNGVLVLDSIFITIFGGENTE